MRKTYGNTWWGKQWLNALNRIDYSNRLPRGRRYANNGSVLEINIEKNHILARVQGSRPSPYKVSISIPVFDKKEQRKIAELVTSNPIFLSKLLNRELPPALNEACWEIGIAIFPDSWNDLKGSCSCPDWAVPCKHMAAVLYLVANEIDKNPFLVFELHNFDLFEGLEKVGYSQGGRRDIHIPSVEELRHAADAPTEVFEWDAATFKSVDFSKIPDCRDQLLTLLTEKPVFFPSGNFKAILEKVYSTVAKNAAKAARQHAQKQLSPIVDATENLKIQLDEEADFISCTMFSDKGETLLNIEEIKDFIEWIQQIPMGRIGQLSPVLRGLILTYHFAEKLAMQSAYIPQLLSVGENHYKIRWQAATLNERVRDQYEKIEALTPDNLLYFPSDKGTLRPIEGQHFPTLLSLFLDNFVLTHRELDFRNDLTEVLLLFFNGSVECFDTFENKESPAAIHLWLSRFYIAEKDYVPILKVEDRKKAFYVSVAVEQKHQPLEIPVLLKHVLSDDRYSSWRIDLLRDLSMLTDHFPQIGDLISSGADKPLRFDSNDFVPILFQVLPTMRLFGIKVLLPKALRKLTQPRLSMQLEGDDSGVVKRSSAISLENMLSFSWQIAIGDQLIDPQQFRQQIQQFSGIVKLQDQYVYLDEKEIRSLIEKLENPPTLDGRQLLKVALTESYDGAKVKLDEEARKILDKLLGGEETPVPKGLKATLRPYQLRGYEWLYKNSRLGFGSLIADDMGLGKTLQVIATLLKLKEDGEFKSRKGLIIVPTTLLTNWEKEIQKFAPTLRLHLYHGPQRDLEPLQEADVLITTYGIVRSESTKLQKLDWLTIVIDEAQNIKNPATAQTKAVKKIKAPVRIAMSGTPVENRLSEYWSIFDFSNKGYLQSLKKFKDNYARPIEVDRDRQQLQRFRKITEPFILRRLKTDKMVISDLPDKIEKDQFCQLTTQQAALYQNVLNNTMETIEASEGINRRGLILKLITALKQVCNHPRHFLKKGKKDPDLSGKTQLLLTLLQDTLDNGEKSLIFTQYQAMGKLLVEMLRKEFGFEAPFLHGGVSRRQRDEMVQNFQESRSNRIFLLSLKAGGTGLNLTAASNVIHYDLWWNPAVEAQATDRAFRIGQTRNVLVHRFITKGTFEEKINQLLLSKKELANLTVSTGEKWIGELSDAELRDLVKLDA